MDGTIDHLALLVGWAIFSFEKVSLITTCSANDSDAAIVLLRLSDHGNLCVTLLAPLGQMSVIRARNVGLY